MRREKGITLVALVITIIVLIILAGVSIRAIMDGGLITNAKGAKEEWQGAKADEEGKLGTLIEKLEGKKVESENGSIVLESASGENLKNYRIYGNSEQSGEPVEIKSVGDNTVNLFDSDLWLEHFDKLEDGSYHSNKRIMSTLQIPFNLKAGTYTISLDVKYPANAHYRPYMKDSDGNNIYTFYTRTDNEEWLSLKYTFTTNVDVAYMNWTYNTYTDDLYFRNFQIQEGTVATDYEPYGYKIPVKVSGKNLFSMAKAQLKQQTVNGITFTPLDDERIHIKGKATDTTISTVYNPKLATKIPIKAGTYKVKPNKYTNKGLTMMYAIYNGTTFVVNANVVHSSSVVSTDGEITLIHIGISAGTTIEFDDIIELQIVQGTENLPYEPYVEPITTNIYLDEPLRSIGDKADYIDFKEQKVVRYIKEENGVLSELEQPEEEKTTLPNIPTFEGTTNITINTTIQPSKIEVNY